MIRTLKDTGADYPISSNIDGSVYAIATQDCVIGGMGDEFSVTTSASSLSLTFTQGSVAVLCGNAFWLTADETVTLPANSTFNLCARIDTSKPNGQTGSFECLTEAGMKNNNINNGGIRDLILYTITTSANGVTSIVDKRTIITTATYATKTYVDEKNNTAVSKANSAQATADSAVSKANSAQATADSAVSKANSALSRQNISMSLSGDTLYINFNMSIIVNGSNKGNFIANNKQLQKVYANGVLVWENWKPWSNSASGSWDSYPSSPKYATVNVPANTRVTHISAVSSKAYVEGEYGKTIIEGYYNGSWHELASSEPGFSESSCSWSGDIYMSSVRSRFEFQVCRDVMTKVSVSGLTKG